MIDTWRILFTAAKIQRWLVPIRLDHIWAVLTFPVYF